MLNHPSVITRVVRSQIVEDLFDGPAEEVPDKESQPSIGWGTVPMHLSQAKRTYIGHCTKATDTLPSTLTS